MIATYLTQIIVQKDGMVVKSAKIPSRNTFDVASTPPEWAPRKDKCATLITRESGMIMENTKIASGIALKITWTIGWICGGTIFATTINTLSYLLKHFGIFIFHISVRHMIRVVSNPSGNLRTVLSQHDSDLLRDGSKDNYTLVYQLFILCSNH
jgi:hypothetical protein